MSDIFRELCAEVLAYSEGRGKYNFSHLSPYDRDNAAFDAWQDITQRLKTALADNDQSSIADSSHPSDEEFAALMPQDYPQPATSAATENAIQDMADKKANKVDHPFLLDRRFEIRMTLEMEKLLNDLAAQTGMNRAEIFRRSIGLYKLAKGVESRGGKILMAEPNGHTQQIVGL